MSKSKQNVEIFYEYHISDLREALKNFIMCLPDSARFEVDIQQPFSKNEYLIAIITYIEETK